MGKRDRQARKERKARKEKERQERKARKAAKGNKSGGGNKRRKEPVLAEGGIPMPGRKGRDPFYLTVMPIQNELLKLHRVLKENNERVIVIFEGRYAAGKESMIERFCEFMLPKGLKTFDLRPADETEQGQWYFQRFIKELPKAGDVAFFNRSWYTRAWVDPVTGACSDADQAAAMAFIPSFEKALMDEGFKIFKFWLSISPSEQKARMEAWQDSLESWRFDNMELDSPEKREEFTIAKEAMLAGTSQSGAPWIVVDANNQQQAQINTLRYFISQFDYPEKREDLLKYDEQIIKSA
ncbi:polyphosphate kinase 2 [Magnetococcales bacterium HHB-1]